MRKLLFRCLFTLAIFIGGAGAGQWLVNNITASAQADGAPLNLPVKELEEFKEIYQLIRQNYVENIEGGELIRRAARGMVASLDPHSAYLDIDEKKQFVDSLTNQEYGGVGIYIGSQKDWIQAIAPIYNSPADRAGIKAGDIILTIDGTPTKDMPVEEAVKKMRGLVDTILKLNIRPAAGGDIRPVELIRENIVTPSVLSARAEGDYGYLRITHFKDKTMASLVNGVNGIMDERNTPLKGIVLDLRNNPGGFLTAGIGAAAIFLPSGSTVVSEKGRGGTTRVFTAGPDFSADILKKDRLKTIPMVVLVNNGSASASEIVAGALQDHRRALILGTRTYGKASVQGLVPLSASKGKSALRLTTARYFTPLDRNIQARGIEPDIVIHPSEVTQRREGIAIREDDIDGHLENEDNSDGGGNGESAPAGDRPPFIGANDYQYQQALQTLKALALTHQAG